MPQAYERERRSFEQWCKQQQLSTATEVPFASVVAFKQCALLADHQLLHVM
jgi:hypothetical protein